MVKPLTKSRGNFLLPSGTAIRLPAENAGVTMMKKHRSMVKILSSLQAAAEGTNVPEAQNKNDLSPTSNSTYLSIDAGREFLLTSPTSRGLLGAPSTETQLFFHFQVFAHVLLSDEAEVTSQFWPR